MDTNSLKLLDLLSSGWCGGCLCVGRGELDRTYSGLDLFCSTVFHFLVIFSFLFWVVR